MNHHAYFFAGDREEGILAALAYGERVLALIGPTNPDIITLRYDLFSVEEARGVHGIANRTSTKGEAKLVIIAAHRIFHEAQNALLKVFEEPAPGTYLVLIVPSEGNIIPTLRSRLLPLPQHKIHIKTDMIYHISQIADEFLKAGKAEREKIVSKILERAKSDKQEEKQAARIETLRLAEDLVRATYAMSREQAAGGRRQKDKELVAFLTDLNHFIPMLHERSAPLKPILEHLLITAPTKL